MLKKMYRWLLNATSRPDEKGEYSGGYWQDRARREALALCAGLSGRALEVGCGEGFFLAQLARENGGLKLWGIDNNEARLSAAVKRLKGVELSRQDATRLSFEDSYFDAVICINVLFNMASMEDVKRSFGEMRRVCKSGGSVIFDFRNSANPFLWLKYRLARYYDDTVRDLPLKTYRTKEIEVVLKDLGMAIVEKRSIGFGLPFPAAVIVVKARRS